jgi:hypothetical protein
LHRCCTDRWAVGKTSPIRYRAAELGQLAREQQSIEKSIIESSTDATAAKRDRDKGLSMADIRKNAAERWLEYRERQKDIEKDPAEAKDNDVTQELQKGNGKRRSGMDDVFSM